MRDALRRKGHTVTTTRCSVRPRLSGMMIAAVFVAVAVLGVVSFSSPAIAANKVPVCFHNQVVVAVAWDLPPAAGSNGIPFIIANTSNSACSLEGYPKLIFINGKYKKHSVTVSDGGGGLFAAVRPRTVVIKPGGTASFGLGFGDAANQQDPNTVACTTQSIYVSLPVRDRQFSGNYETTVDINFCYSNFEFNVTPFERGPLPKQR